jgi:hypothetical protein
MAKAYPAATDESGDAKPGAARASCAIFIAARACAADPMRGPQPNGATCLISSKNRIKHAHARPLQRFMRASAEMASEALKPAGASLPAMAGLALHAWVCGLSPAALAFRKQRRRALGNLSGNECMRLDHRNG